MSRALQGPNKANKQSQDVPLIKSTGRRKENETKSKFKIRLQIYEKNES